MLRLVSVCRPAKAFIFYSAGHPDVCTAIIIIITINSLAVPIVQYSFGIFDWKISELKKIDTKTRKLLNMHKMLHPKADMERLYIPRKGGGRSLIEVATIGLDHYLHET